MVTYLCSYALNKSELDPVLAPFPEEGRALTPWKEGGEGEAAWRRAGLGVDGSRGFMALSGSFASPEKLQIGPQEAGLPATSPPSGFRPRPKILLSPVLVPAACSEIRGFLPKMGLCLRLSFLSSC